MKKGPIYLVIQERKVTLFVVFILMIFGLYSYHIAPKQEFPNISPPVALITAVYPGASSEDIQGLVTKKIEDEITSIKGYDTSNSTSRNSLATIILELKDGTDTNQAWTDLRQKLEDLSKELPEGTILRINTDLMKTAGMIISLTGDNYTYEELADYAEEFEDELRRIEGVSGFDLIGKIDKEVRIDVDIQKLNYYNVSLNDITKLIQAQNIQIPSGKIEEGHTKIGIQTTGNYESIKEIQDTVIAASSQNGAVVRLKDIADVEIALDENSMFIKNNGKNAVLLAGYFEENKNVILVGKEVEQKMNEMKKHLPKDIIFEEVHFQSKDVSKSVNDFIINLIEGIVFVIIVVFVGMGFRNAIIVSTAIPTSILVTFGMMQLLNVNIHQVSIAALIIALGMLVDNAIVVSDAIQVRLDHGQEKIEACIEGVREVAIPMLTSTLTTVGAFLPLLLLTSTAGEYIKSIPQIVIVSLTASYMVALFVTPTMAYIFFKKTKKNEKTSKVRLFFDHLLDTAMNRKKSTMVLALIMFVSSLYIVTHLGMQFFPKSDKNIIYINVKTEQSTDLSQTERLADQVEEILKGQKEIISYTSSIGGGLPKFFDTMPIAVESPDFAQFMLRLDLKKGDRFKNNGELADYLQELFDSKISSGSAIVKQLEQGEAIGAPINAKIKGKDLEVLQEVAEQIKQKLRSIEGTLNVEDDFAGRFYEFYLDVDVDKASHFGVTKYDMQNEVSIALRGRQASMFRKNGNEYGIVVKGNINSKEQLENLLIKSSITGKKVLLKEIAKVTLQSKIAEMKRADRELTITVSSDVKAGTSAMKVQDMLQREIDRMDLGDVKISFDGEKESIGRNFGDLGALSIFALLVIYMILLVQFNSFVQPIMILLTVPLSLIGSILGLFITSQPLSFTGLLGIVSLIGIVVNNAIVLVDFINNERKNGISIEEACREAVDKRFRPIMLSTTTTVIGLVPLVASGSQLFSPLGTTLMAGLMVSTLLILVVIPVAYSMIEEKFEVYHNKKQRKNLSTEA